MVHTFKPYDESDWFKNFENVGIQRGVTFYNAESLSEDDTLNTAKSLSDDDLAFLFKSQLGGNHYTCPAWDRGI